MLRGLVWSVVALGLGCRTPPALPPVPSQGGPAWTELASEHFVMWTDASPRRGRELLVKMERLHQIVSGVAFPMATTSARILVVVFRNEEERGAFVPAQFTAFAWAGNAIFQPVIVLDADADADDARVLTHELTHVISYAVLPAQPRWFAEGLAGFFETVNLNAAGTKAEVGKPLLDMVRRIGRGNTTPVAQLFACAALACMDERYYATTWLLVTYLVNRHPADLLRYLDRLAVVPEAAQAAVWAEVFPALTPATLDHEIRAWLTTGRARVWSFDLALATSAVRERPLGDADVLAVRGLLRYVFDRDAPVEPPEIGAALAVDATSLLAHLTRASRTRTMDLATARALVAAHPGDWRTWWWLAFELQRASPGPELVTVRRTLCELAAGSHLLPPRWCPAP